MLQDFKAFVKSQLRDASLFDEAGFNGDLEFIRAMLRYEIDVALFDVATARRHLLEKDPQAQYALTLFPEAMKLLRAAPVKATRSRNNNARTSFSLPLHLGLVTLATVTSPRGLSPVFGGDRARFGRVCTPHTSITF